jgi:hypothetical protein
MISLSIKGLRFVNLLGNLGTFLVAGIGVAITLPSHTLAPNGHALLLDSPPSHQAITGFPGLTMTQTESSMTVRSTSLLQKMGLEQSRLPTRGH